MNPKVFPKGAMFMTDYYTPVEKKKKKKKSSSGEFFGYCNRLCRSSLITGFPVIAESRSILRKLIKTCVFLVCSAGFIYQTTDFLNMYFAYPTMVDVKMYIPEDFEMPAITVCNKNRIKRRSICTHEEEKCVKYKNRKEFCSIFPKSCSPIEDDEEIVLAAMNTRFTYELNKTWSYVKNMGFMTEETIEGCIIKKKGPCENYVYVPAVDSMGEPNNCFAVESLWGEPNGVIEMIHPATVILMRLLLHPEEYLNKDDFIQFYFAVHDAFLLMNPMFEGMMLDAGNVYNVYVTQVLKIFLPAPYVTNCTDYMKEWKQNGGTGPVNQRMCIEKCKMDAMLKDFNCVDPFIIYPNNHTFCPKAKETISQDTVSRCSKGCQPACRDITYHTRVEIKGDMSKLCMQDDQVCPESKAVLNFLFHRMEITEFKHQPKYESVEMFSYIGGYMGMWLGISLVALFDFVETMAYLFYYPCRGRNRRRMKKFHHVNNQKVFYKRYDI